MAALHWLLVRLVIRWRVTADNVHPRTVRSARRRRLFLIRLPHTTDGTGRDTSPLVRPATRLCCKHCCLQCRRTQRLLGVYAAVVRLILHKLHQGTPPLCNCCVHDKVSQQTPGERSCHLLNREAGANLLRGHLLHLEVSCKAPAVMVCRIAASAIQPPGRLS